jgi:hypothetical protein
MARARKPKTEKAQPPPLPVASDRDKERNARAERVMKQRYEDKPRTPLLKIDVDDEGKVAVANGHADEDAGFAWRIAEVLGVYESNLASLYASQLLSVVNAPNSLKPAALRQGLAFMAGLGPQNELEGALGVQVWATHCATIELTRRMREADSLERVREYSNLMNKTARTFTAQIEALSKLRSGGKQQVVVTHVQVQGNAVVGDGAQAVMQYGGAGGGAGNGHQAQAIGGADALGAQVWSADPLGMSMSGTGGERSAALPDARWSARHGSAQGQEERELSPRTTDPGSGTGAAEVSGDPQTSQGHAPRTLEGTR